MRNLGLTMMFIAVIICSALAPYYIIQKNTTDAEQYTNQLNKEGYYKAFFSMDYVDCMRINTYDDYKEYYIVYTDYDTELIQKKVKTDSTTYFKLRECMIKDTILYTFYMYEKENNFVIVDSLYKVKSIIKQSSCNNCF